MKALLLTLLMTTAALAQPVVGPEVTTPPLTALGDISLAPQSGGFVVAWEQAGRIYAGHLDATLHLTGALLELPRVNPPTQASSPAIASNGTSVLVAWHERGLGYADSTSVAVLSADAQTLRRGPLSINLTTAAPLATSVNGKYIVYTGDLRYRYNENLDVEAGEFIAHNRSAALGPNGDVATMKESTNGLSCVPICFGRPCQGGPVPDCIGTATVVFSLPSRVSTSVYAFRIPGNTVLPDPFALHPPLIAPNGQSFVGLVQLQEKTDIWLFGNIEQLTLPVLVRGDTAVAGNGQDVLIVWNAPPLLGMIVHADGTSSATFPIASAGYLPKVIALSSNEFAVVYRTDVGTQSAFAGRIIRINPVKHRGIR
jgi:hypothetical protein